ncbi:hypothetical protein MKW92_044294 [Papaver armeniacum]|nr:hypothetical protein MKW92_044294 [Papaver armeniacum]
MAAPHYSLFLAISILVFVCFLSYSSVNALPGGITEIKDMKTNKQVQDLGKFLVDEYNVKFKKGEEGSLTFQKL